MERSNKKGPCKWFARAFAVIKSEITDDGNDYCLLKSHHFSG